MALRDSGESPYSIRAVQRVCDILDEIQSHPEGVSLGDLAEVTQFPKSSAFRYLVSLEERQYLTRGADGLYSAGPALRRSGWVVAQSLTHAALPHMERLRDECGETVNLGVLDGIAVSYLLILESPKSVRLAARIGDRDPLHCTALGKAVAATLPEATVRDLLAVSGQPKRTPKTLTSVDAFLRELEMVRRRGYALDDGENESDGRCVAVSIPTGGVPAAISVSAPMARLSVKDAQRLGRRLVDVALQLDRLTVPGGPS